MSDRDELRALLRCRAVIWGETRLSSGRVSDFYIDAKTVTLDQEGARIVGSVVLDCIQKDFVDAVGGPALGALPIALAVALLSSAPLSPFCVRATPKNHGVRREIEGSIKAGDRVVVVDDVAASGASLLSAMEAVEAVGAQVVRVVVLVDRGEGAREAIASRGCVFSPAFAVEDILGGVGRVRER